MRTLIAFLLLLLTSSAFAQDLELVEALHHKGSYPTANCPKDVNGEYCTIIDVILPGVKIYNIECSNKVGHEEEIPNGKRFFMSVPQKKQKVRVNAMGYQPYLFEVKADEVSKIEVYEIRLRVPSFVPPSPNKKEKLPIFLGYHFSPSAPIGFSVGYCKKIGVYAKGGFSPLAFDQINIKEVYSTLLLTTEQSRNTSSNGKYRTFFQIGGMYRPIERFAIFASAGYGTFADVCEYDRHYFAPKVHDGLECEAGAMFKYKNLGVSLGYVRHIGKKNLFQDVSVGVQWWFGE